MKEYRLFANVNPLAPNCLVSVASSREMACGVEAAYHLLKSKGENLKAQGYEVELHEVIVHIYPL